MIKTPVRAVIAAVGAAAARWSETAFSPRRLARNALAVRTGYSLAAVDYALDRLFEVLAAEAICAVITDELGCLEVLDDFTDRAGRPRARALPLGRVCVIASRTTIGVALTPAIFALAAKCTVLVKDREDGLVASFFETLGEELPELRDSAVARAWRGDEDAVDLAGLDAVVAFGNDATLREIGERLTPRTRFISFGSKAGAGYVTREALCDEAAASRIARAAARDLVLYESEGCLSLHALFVEDRGIVSAQRFGELLTAAVREVATVFPPARDDVATTARYAMARELATFRGGAEAIYANAPVDEPPLFLPRTLGIRCVESPRDAAQYFERHRIELEALAIAGRPDENVKQLAMDAKAARIVPFGAMQAPPIGIFHGGRPRIAEFVRWITDET